MKTYRPNDLKGMTEREMRQEYSRLRRNANRRLANMEKNNLGRWGSNRFASSRGMSAEWVQAALMDVSVYLRDPRHTVKGERDQMNAVIESLKDRGIDYIDEGNFYEFTDFMEELRGQYNEKIFDSSDALEVFGQMQRLGVDRETIMNNYEFFAKNAYKMNRLRIPRSERGTSYKELRRKINRLK